MKTNYRVLILSLFLFGQISYGQTDSTKIEAGKHGNLVAYLYELQQISGVDSIEHTDSISGYSIVIPLWWKIQETPNTYLFGGTFPEIDGIQNALIFKAFDKKKYKNLTEFQSWVITGYKMGDIPKWSNSHKILLKKELNEFSEIGNAFKVQLMRNGFIYDCCYIIVETTNSYLWIDFTATKETYELNFEKLKELLSNYKTL